MGGSGGEPENINTLHPKYQLPLSQDLSSQITGWLRSGTPQFPGYDKASNVYDPAVTDQYFQDVFVAPTMRQLTGPYGSIPRIGAGSAQRGTYFSSGRQHAEAQAVGDTYAGLTGAYADLAGQDQTASYNEWIRTRPEGQTAQQALNYLGTPMMVSYQEQQSPWGALGGAALGGLGGFFLGGPMGAFAGASVGAGVGQAF